MVVRQRNFGKRISWVAEALITNCNDVAIRKCCCYFPRETIPARVVFLWISPRLIETKVFSYKLVCVISDPFIWITHKAIPQYNREVRVLLSEWLKIGRDFSTRPNRIGDDMCSVKGAILDWVRAEAFKAHAYEANYFSCRRTPTCLPKQPVEFCEFNWRGLGYDLGFKSMASDFATFVLFISSQLRLFVVDHISVLFICSFIHYSSKPFN